ANDGGSSGGAVTYLAGADSDSLDPGRAYQPYSWAIDYALNRPLYSYAPDDTAPRPDLAASPPVISADGRRVTVRMRSDVRFSPPVNRSVVSSDVRYAIERAFTPAVANGYARAYLGALDGVGAFLAGKVRHIQGIALPDAHTIVFRLHRPTGYRLARALSLPISAPVPERYARRYDRGATSRYAKHMVATGPYMVGSYRSGSSLTLVRNPNWVRSTDYRPAPADRIAVRFDSGDVGVAARQILATPATLSGGGMSLPPALEKAIVGQHHGAYELLDTGAYAYAALSPAIPPFDDLNVRRAVAAGLNRVAIRQVQGGPLAGPIATHFLAPSMRGFDAAGGRTGFGFDFLAHPRGNPALARAYFRKAGYPSGRPSTAPAFTMPVVSDSAAFDEVVGQQLQNLGFRVRFRTVGWPTQYKVCGHDHSDFPVCDSTWLKDLDDGFTTLDVPFTKDGLGGFNYERYDDRAVDDALARADAIQSPAARARAMAGVDRLITSKALGVPLYWTRQLIFHGPKVHAIHNVHNQSWDLSFSGAVG
ncbi:MAG: peptide/nickel transport system substrate-binding protein, partial [Thermoleophilaceae bacterium]|nr:peptide/nickel transport system substrate-binding protein [Thermoleophilaceae bacterium]